MEYVNCILCGSDDFKILIEIQDDLFFKSTDGSKGRFVICKKCGLVYQNPRLSQEELSEVYKKEYRDEEPSERYLLARFNEGEKRICWIEDGLSTHMKDDDLFGKERKVLDIGSSTGAFLSVFRQHGWSVFGVEPNRLFAEYAIKKFSLPVEIRMFSPNTWWGLKFDLITIKHVFEHIPDPIGFLEIVKEKLKKNGLIFIEVPSITRLRRGNRSSLKSDHLYAFSSNTLKGFLGKAGFEVVDLEEFGRGVGVLIKEATPIQPDFPRDDYREISLMVDRARKTCFNKRAFDVNELIEPICTKQQAVIRLSRGEMVLLLVNSILTQNLKFQSGPEKIKSSKRLLKTPVNKVLIIQILSNESDLTTLISELKEIFPKARLFLLTTEKFSEAVKEDPFIEKVIVYPAKRCRKDIMKGNGIFWEIIADAYEPLKQLELMKFDLVINLSKTPLSAFMTYFVGTKNIYGLTVDKCGNPLLID